MNTTTNKISAATIARTACLLLALTVAAALVSWWKNNSFTREALAADSYLTQLRNRK